MSSAVIPTSKTIREIVSENPSSVPVFESLGIDYCCGGQRSLSDACSRAGISATQVLDLLNKAEQDSAERHTPDKDWNRETLSELSSHIEKKHHTYVRQEIPRIDALLAKVVARHGPAHPEVLEIQRIFSALEQELTTHMMKEERILFPYIEQMELAVASGRVCPPAFFGSVTRPIASMMAEHDDAGELLQQMQSISGGYVPPVDACATYKALYDALSEFQRDLHQHIHLENNILFPRAEEMERTHGGH